VRYAVEVAGVRPRFLDEAKESEGVAGWGSPSPRRMLNLLQRSLIPHAELRFDRSGFQLELEIFVFSREIWSTGSRTRQQWSTPERGKR